MLSEIRNPMILDKGQQKLSVTMKTTFIVSTLFLLFACSQAFGQVKLYMSGPKSVPVNQNFQLDITIENGNPKSLKPPAFNDFQVLGGPNSSSQFQLGNGGVSQSITYSYVLKPKQEGTFKIGKASININGVNMESNELSIEVTKAVAQSQAQQRQRNTYDPFDDPFFKQHQQQEPEPPAADLTKQAKDDVFVKLLVSKNSVYKGEMVTATYKLYLRQNITPPNISKAPAFDGFWSQEVELDPKRGMRPGTETVNGKQYQTVELMKYNLYPQHAGKLQIASLDASTVVQMPLRTKSRNIFDEMFNGGRVQQIPLNLKTEAVSITVKDLPETGKPADFTGAVGKFNFETSLSNKEGKTDDPITYSVKISGTGNLKLIEAPKLQLPPSFEVYDPKVKENITNGAAGITGSKQYDFLIIPRQPGEYKLDKHVFSYFDPSTEKYVTINSPEYSLKITGEPSKNMNTNTASVNKQDVSVVGQDIRYIKTNAPQFNKNDDAFFGSIGYYGAYTAPVLLFLALAALKRRNEDMAADVMGTKRRRALKLAKKRLSVADKHLQSNDKKLFYDEVSRALWGYVGDRLNIDTAELSKENVGEKLVNKSVKPETIANLQNLIATCDLALYAPVGENGEMNKNYETALNLIADIEDEIK